MLRPRFPEHRVEAVYNTADATLWHFHAIDRYLETAQDRVTLRRFLPKLVAIASAKLQIFLEPRCARFILIERRQDLVCVKDIG